MLIMQQISISNVLFRKIQISKSLILIRFIVAFLSNDYIIIDNSKNNVIILKQISFQFLMKNLRQNTSRESFINLLRSCKIE